MRMKAIPGEIESFTAKHATLLIGAAALAVGGYYYLNHQSATANANANPTASTSQAQVIPYQVPADYGGGSGGLVDSTTNPNAPTNTAPSPTPAAPGPPVSSTGLTGGTDLDWAIFGLESQKQQNDFTLAEQTLNAQLAIAQNNAAIAAMGIQAANWQTSANLAQAFLISGNQFFAGDVGGQTFAFIAGGNPNVYQGKNQQQVLAMQQDEYNQFLATYGGDFVQPATGTAYAVPYLSPTPSAPLLPSGSVYTAPSTGGNTTGGTQQTATGGGGAAVGGGVGGGGGPGNKVALV